MNPADKDIQVAVYSFPNYHLDPRYPGHRQPRVPAWGYEEESDPAFMARKIDTAADHGEDAFLFDWYQYPDGPYLERALEQGFWRAPNRERLKFAIHAQRATSCGPTTTGWTSTPPSWMKFNSGPLYRLTGLPALITLQLLTAYRPGCLCFYL